LTEQAGIAWVKYIDKIPKATTSKIGIQTYTFLSSIKSSVFFNFHKIAATLIVKKQPNPKSPTRGLLMKKLNTLTNIGAE